MSTSNKIKELLFGESFLPYLLVASYAAVFFVFYGMGVAELIGYTALAQNLFAPLAGHYQSLYGSVLGPIIARSLGISTQTGYIIMSLCILALGLWALTRSVVRMSTKAGGTRLVLDALLLLGLSPLLLVFFSFVGKTDVLIVLSYLAFITVRHPLARNAAVVCLLLSHEEIGILILVVHYLLNPSELRKLQEFLPGVVLAVGSMSLYHHLLPPYENRVAFVLAPERWGGWLNNLVMLPLIAWTGFGWFWLVIGWAFLKRWLPRLTLVAALALPIAAGALTYDSTRVILLVGFPVIWTILGKYLEQGKSLPYKIVIPAVVLSLLQSRYQTGDFRLLWSNWHTSPWEQMLVWKNRYF